MEPPIQLPTSPNSAPSEIKVWITKYVNETIPRLIDGVAETVRKTLGQCTEEKSESTSVTAILALKNAFLNNGEIIALTDSLPDVESWNQTIQLFAESENGGKTFSFQDLPLFWTESYINRSLAGILNEAGLPNDEYQEYKSSTFYDVFPFLSQTSLYLMEALQEIENSQASKAQAAKKFITEFLTLSAFTNQLADKYEPTAEALSQLDNPIQEASKLRDRLIIDRIDAVVHRLVTNGAPENEEKESSQTSAQEELNARRIDLVLGGSQLELFVDMCCAELLITAGVASQVVFRASLFSPLDYSSEADFRWMFRTLGISNSMTLARCRGAWQQLLKDGRWKVETSSFWTLPRTFCQMEQQVPGLLEDLAKSGLVFLKGDWNYRKLVADRYWDTQKSLKDICAEFKFPPLCIVRPVLSPLIVNLDQEQTTQWKEMEQKPDVFNSPNAYCIVDFIE